MDTAFYGVVTDRNFFSIVQILNEDGSKLEPDTDKGRNIIGCIQQPAYSMFKAVEVKAGNEIISDSYQSYHLASYFMVSTRGCVCPSVRPSVRP